MLSAAPLLVGLLVGLAVAGWGRGAAPGLAPGPGGRPLRWRRARGRGSAAGAVVGPADAALAMDLLAAVLRSGAPVAGALAVVGEALGGPDGDRLRAVAEHLALGAAGPRAWAGAGPRWAAVARCLELAAASGAPAAALLDRAAARERSDRGHRRAAAAQRLGVRVLLPLGTCALPAFAALGVVPLVLSLAGSLTGL